MSSGENSKFDCIYKIWKLSQGVMFWNPSEEREDILHR